MGKFRTNRVMGTEYTHSTGEDCSAEKHGNKVIENDALTPQEILERYANGIDIKRLQKFGIYDDPGTELEDLVLSSRFTDLTEVDRLIRRADELENKIQEAKDLKIELEKAKKEPEPEPEPPVE